MSSLPAIRSFTRFDFSSYFRRSRDWGLLGRAVRRLLWATAACIPATKLRARDAEAQLVPVHLVL